MTNLQRPYFQSVQWSASTAYAVLSAMKAVATLNGSRPFDPSSIEMLTAVQDWVFHTEVDVEHLGLLSPLELAKQVRDRQQRQQALQFIILMPYLDMQVDEEEVQLVHDFAAAFHLAPQTLKSLRLVRDHRFKQLLFEFTWRALSDLGLEGLWPKIKLTLNGLRQYFGDRRVSSRYQALSSLPPGTLGRELYDYYRNNNIPLPGEKQSLSEALVGHDLVHVLSGIGIDTESEITVGGFEAGMSRSEFGFELLLEVLLDFHLGLEFSTVGIVEPERNRLNPSALMEAYVRGLQLQFDLLDPNWNYEAVFDQPITELRERYGIPEQTSLSVMNSA